MLFGVTLVSFAQDDFQAREEGRLDCLAEVVKEDLTLDPFSSSRDDVMGWVPLDASILHRDIVEEETWHYLDMCGARSRTV